MFGSLLTAVAAVGAWTGGREVDVGDAPRHTFQRAPRNGVLVRSLEDLRGAPALFEFWGPNCPGCVQGAVPQALDLQEKWGADLQVVFVEVQGAGDDEAARFALRERWFGGRALWTSEVPFWPGGSRLPSFVLLGNDGRVLLEGNPLTQSREIGRLVAAEVRARRAPPASAPHALRPAWTEFLRGNLGRASQMLAQFERERAAAPGTDDADAREADALRRAIEARFARAAALAAAGHFEDFDAELDGLRAGAGDDPATRERVQALAVAWSGPELAAERSADRRLKRLLARFFETGGAAAPARELEQFAEAQARTRAGARAAEWSRLTAGPGPKPARR